MATPSDQPLRQLTLDKWSSDIVQRALDERPLLLLIHQDRGQEAQRQRRIVLFVHGLQSGATTWLSFLEQAFPTPELRPYDFGLFNYQTSVVSRLRPFQRLPRPEDWARVLASVIRNVVLEQQRYDSYVLVGHSMGGLVAKFAIRYLLEDDKAAASRLHSLFTYGTPNHGSDRANAIGALFSPDLAFLRNFSGPLQDLQTFWNTRISAVPEMPGRVTVHERAIVSVKDYWVATASGISSLPEAFVQRLASSHTGLLKPTGPADPRLAWFIDQLRAIQRRSECTLIDLRNGPTPEDFVGEDAGEKLIQALFRALFVFDAGSLDGMAKGDELGLYYDSTEVRDADGHVVDRIPGSMNILGAAEVKERVTYCTLKSFAYEAALRGMEAAIAAMDSQGDEPVDAAQVDKLVLALFGSRAVRIPRVESDAMRAIDDVYGRVLEEDDRESAARSKALRELVTASRDFLATYPSSLLADHAAFQEAWATKELERFDEAETLFERFVKNYPFSTSVSGAHAHLDEIRLQIRLRKSDNAAEAQLDLAEYWFKDGRRAEDAMHLAFAAIVAKPGLTARLTPGMRFLLTGQYVFHELLGMDFDAPQAMAELLDQYAADPHQREAIKARVSVGAPADRAAILLRLLDSTLPADKPSAAVAEQPVARA